MKIHLLLISAALVQPWAAGDAEASHVCANVTTPVVTLNATVVLVQPPDVPGVTGEECERIATTEHTCVSSTALTVGPADALDAEWNATLCAGGEG